ncbi:MAG: dihydrofolate reductase [Oscillospiraceae bacterium]|nr:dihydrofolate reductase [Oscillospiraceae bacterium]
MQAIVCISENWGIGRDGQLLFRISADLKRFKALTVGKTVVLGSRTLKTFPNGKPLPNRRSIVLTRSEAPIGGAELAHTTQDALALAGEDALVIGGASVYTLLLPYCDRVLVTKVFAAPEADSFFPNLDAHPDWRVASESEVMEENGLKFQYVDYIRK